MDAVGIRAILLGPVVDQPPRVTRVASSSQGCNSGRARLKDFSVRCDIVTCRPANPVRTPLGDWLTARALEHDTPSVLFGQALQHAAGRPVERMTRPALVVGPLLLLGSSVAYAAGEGIGDDKVGGAIQVWAFILLGIGLVGLARHVESHRPAIAAALTAATLIGVSVGAGFGIDSIWTEVTGLSIDDDAVSGPALFMPGLSFPVALFAHAARRFRIGLGPKLPAVLLAVGAVLFPLSRIPSIDVLALIADLCIAAALIPIALAIPTRTRSDAEVY